MPNNDILDLDARLDRVSYDDIENFVPTDETIKFFTFVDLVMKSNMNEEEINESVNSTPAMHYKFIDDILRGYGRKHRKPEDCYFINLFHRGAGKTTVGAIMLLFYIAARGKEDLGLTQSVGAIYLGDSVENGCRTLYTNMESFWNNNKLLQTLLPRSEESTDSNKVVKYPVFSENVIILKSASGLKTEIRLKGIGGNIRGTMMDTRRPQIIIIDDVITDKDARSETQPKAIYDLIMSSLDGATEPNTKYLRVIWNGTPFNKKDPICMGIESGAWNVNVFPICEKFPCTKEEFKGSWEDRFPYEIVQSKYNRAKMSGSLRPFYKELMLRVSNDEERIILPHDIRWFNREKILANPQNYYFYITSDLAVTKKSSSDYTVIGVWAVDKNRNWYLIDGRMEKQTTDVIFDFICEYLEKYNIQQIGLERSGQQAGVIDMMVSKAVDRDVYFPVATHKGTKTLGIIPTGDKLSRFLMMVPYFKEGKIHFPTELANSKFLQTGIGQLYGVTYEGITSKNDDFIDMISMCNQMNVYYPSDDNGIDDSYGTRKVKSTPTYDSPWLLEEEEYYHNSGSAYDEFIV